MDSRKLRRKRPFPPFPISLITLLGVKKLNANAEVNFRMFGNNLSARHDLLSPPLWRGEGDTTGPGVCGSPPSLPHKGRGIAYGEHQPHTVDCAPRLANGGSDRSGFDSALFPIRFRRANRIARGDAGRSSGCRSGNSICDSPARKGGGSRKKMRRTASGTRVNAW